MNSFLTHKDLIWFINYLKIDATFGFRNNDFASSVKSLQNLSEELNLLSEELKSAHELSEVAKELCLERENSQFIVQGFSSFSDDLYFRISLRDVMPLYKKVARQSISIEKIKCDIRASYERLYKSLIVERWDNPRDSLFLSHIMFGQGRFVIPLEDRLLFYSFGITNSLTCQAYQEHQEHQERTTPFGPDAGAAGPDSSSGYLLHYELEPETSFIHGSIERTLLEQPYMHHVIINSPDTDDPQLMLNIAAQKYVDEFATAAEEREYLTVPHNTGKQR